MKKSRLILAVALAFSSISFAQESTTVSVVEETISKENGMGFKTRINRADEKAIAKEWKSQMKDYDGDVKVKKSIITSEEVMIESMGSDPLRVIAEIRNVTNTTHDFVVIFIKNGQAVTAANDLAAFTAAKTIVKLFSNKVSQEATNDYQKAQLKLFEDLEKDFEDLKKDQKKAEDDIEDAKEEIKKAEEEIKEAKKTIKEKSSEVENLKEKQVEMGKKVETQRNTLKKANEEVELFK